MSEKKELNNEELEKVTGGYRGGQSKKENVTFNIHFRVGYEVALKVVGSVYQAQGKISERGIAYYNGYYYPIYYVIITSGKGGRNGWYYDSDGYLRTDGEVDSRNIVQTGIYD